MLIVFGSEDTVIDLKHSLKFYTEKVSHAKIEVYEDRDHLLMSNRSTEPEYQFSAL